MVVFAVIAALVLRFTPFGRWVYAAGGNERAAALSGVPVRKVKMRVYMISGLLRRDGGHHHLARS